MYCSINVLILAHNDESIHEVVARDEKKTLHQKKNAQITNTSNGYLKSETILRNEIKIKPKLDITMKSDEMLHATACDCLAPYC